MICPICEIWLIEVSIEAGCGSFYCLRCNDDETRLIAKPLLATNGFPTSFHLKFEPIQKEISSSRAAGSELPDQV